MPKCPWTPVSRFFYNALSSRLSRQAHGGILTDFRIAGDLHSKPRKSLCDRILLTFTTVSRCLHSLTFGRHDRFGCLCNQILPKKLRFSLQRHKTQEFCKAEFWDSMPVSAFASENSCFRNSHEQKLQNSAKPNSGGGLPVFAFETGIFFSNSA